MTSPFPRDVILRPTDPAFTPTVANYDVDLRVTYPIVRCNGRTYKAFLSDAGLGVAEAGDLVFRSLSRENFESLWQLLDVSDRADSRKAEP